MNIDNAYEPQKNTKEKLLDTALEMFWMESYRSVSIDDICKKANVKKGSFYHYFPSKADFAIEVFDYLWNSYRNFLNQAFSPLLSPEERLHAYAEMVYAQQKEKMDETGKVPGCPYTTCSGEMCTQDERIRAKISEVFNNVSVYFEGVLKDINAVWTMPISMAANQMTCYAIGVLFQAKIKNDVEIIRRDLETGLLRFLSPG